MKKFALALLGATAVLSASPALAAVDVVDATNGGPDTYFAPGTGATTSAPYYRWHDEDWGWTHGAIAGPITTASLFISGYDVDFGEVDNIYGMKNGVQTLIGALTQTGSNVFSYTEFTLDSSWFDDISNGLELWVDIDVTTRGSWALTLGKSVLTTDGSTPPDPTPGAVPEPATWLMMILGFGAVGGVMRRKRRETLTVRYA